MCDCEEIDYLDYCRNDYMWNPNKWDHECNKACKIDEYLDIKNCSCEKRVIDKLVIECEEEILNTNEAFN